jgi:cobalt-zinc-cadmium efflux system outer membrane protein
VDQVVTFDDDEQHMLPRRGRRGHIGLLLFSSCALACCFGCTADTAQFAAPRLDVGLRAMTGHHLRGDDDGPLPPDVDPDDSIDAEDAVAIALWNNPDFAATLAELGVSRARLAESGLLRNPVLSLLFPVGPKQLEFSVTWPLEALWQRSGRVAAARADCEQAAARLLQHGLDLVLQVRLAWIDRELAIAQQRLAQRAQELAIALAEAGARRLAAGDIGAAESDRLHADALAAERDRVQRDAEVANATDRLEALLAWRPDGGLGFVTGLDDLPTSPTRSAAQLTEIAVAARPALRAAEYALEAAGEAAGLARQDWLQLSAIVDANGDGKEGFEIGPGLAAVIPLFRRGPVGSTAAAVELAMRRYAGVRHRVATEVEAALLECEQARQLVALDDHELRPALAARLEQVRQQVAAGQEPEAAILPAEQALLRVEVDRAAARAALWRAGARLEHALGCRAPREDSQR